MTAKTKEGALVIEAALGAERLAKIKAEAFRAGLEAAAEDAEAFAASCVGEHMRAGRIAAEHMAARIRSIPVPEKL